jgi:hypothetical protein
MNSKWYCKTCGERIETEAVDAHEAEGHTVKGVLRPDRLLPNDPWASDPGDTGGSDDGPTVGNGEEID